MDFKRIAPGLCWFAATCLGLLAFGLALVSITIRAGYLWTPEGLALVVLSGTALVLMAVLIAVAFRMERRQERQSR
ncbi:MAG TPA: hypothetical protein VGP15_14030 [Burkholderiales bacterium]|jgi:hypothetical protein|nr:hypothetical protein [Burkholderiales bacterium]